MASTLESIKAEITGPFMENVMLATLLGFEPGASYDENFSVVSFEDNLINIIAYAIFLREQQQDAHRAEMYDLIFNQKGGRLQWYRYMALNYLDGFGLVKDMDYFDTAGATPQQLAAAKVVKYVAVPKNKESSRIIIKIAGESNGKLAPITASQKEGFEAYMNDTAWAGDDLTVINYLPDKLYLNIAIKRDALILNENGMSKLNGNYPVNEAIQQYMKELPFNGELVLNHLIDKLQKVPGVINPTIISAESAWIKPEENGYGAPEPINISKEPESGYFEVETFDNISYYVV